MHLKSTPLRIRCPVQRNKSKMQPWRSAKSAVFSLNTRILPCDYNFFFFSATFIHGFVKRNTQSLEMSLPWEVADENSSENHHSSQLKHSVNSLSAALNFSPVHYYYRQVFKSMERKHRADDVQNDFSFFFFLHKCLRSTWGRWWSQPTADLFHNYNWRRTWSTFQDRLPCELTVCVFANVLFSQKSFKFFSIKRCCINRL